MNRTFMLGLSPDAPGSLAGFQGNQTCVRRMGYGRERDQRTVGLAAGTEVTFGANPGAKVEKE